MESYLKIELEANDTYYSNPQSLKLFSKIEISIGSLAINSMLENLETVYTPSLNDKLYFLKGVTIPRVKMKNLAFDYKIKTTKNIEDATHIFGCKNTVDKITNYDWAYTIDTNKFKEFVLLAKNHMDSFRFDNLQTALEFYTLPVILTDHNTLHNIIASTILPFAFTYNFSEFDRYSTRFITLDNDQKEVFNAIQNQVIYDESALLLHLNGDGAVEIDNEMFESLNEMFASSDRDNWTLAMEIMANCHYDKSLLYLELLFCDHSYKINDTKTKSHVNFKSLLSFLGKSYGYSTNIDDIMNSLKKHNKFTKENLDIILKLHGDVIQNQGDTTYFKVKVITVDSEVLELMKEDYTYTMLEDPTFEVASPEIEEVVMIEEEIVPEIIEIQVQDEPTDYFTL
jgi:hypothetical protein